MASIPNRLQPDSPIEDNLAMINDNADKTVQDISDIGAKFSQVAFTSATVAAGTYINLLVSISDDRPQYRQGFLPFQPRFDLWVDVDNTANSLYGNAFNTLTAAQRNLQYSIMVTRTTYVVLPTDIGTYEIQIRNFDVNPHTYYVRTDDWYTQSPVTGSFR